MNREILNIDDIKLLVDSFYAKVREDDILGHIFDNIIKDKWPAHLEKMYKFWQTILLGEHTYNGSPFAPHATLPLNELHFNRWLLLFYKTLEENFTGEKVIEAKWRAEKMSEMFQYKLNFQKTSGKSLL